MQYFPVSVIVSEPILTFDKQNQTLLSLDTEGITLREQALSLWLPALSAHFLHKQTTSGP